MTKGFALRSPDHSTRQELLYASTKAIDRTTLRIIDANANRALEALRVAEDFARLGLNHAQYARSLKELRHELRAALERVVPAYLRLNARDIGNDVGTGITTAAERNRDDLSSVAESAFGRAKEALRVLEETAKLAGDAAAGAMSIAKIRYGVYALEQQVLLAARRTKSIERARLYLILTERLCRGGLEPTLRAALRGGVDMVQLREKELSARDYVERARRVQAICQDAGVPFIVNDHVDVAAALAADGVHLGQDDLPPDAARRVLGPGVIVGYSTHSREQLLSDDARAVDYLGVGPVYATATKPRQSPAGLEFLRIATAEAPQSYFAIGGVTRERLDEVIAAGAVRVAVCGAICSAADVESSARALAERLAGVGPEKS